MISFSDEVQQANFKFANEEVNTNMPAETWDSDISYHKVLMDFLPVVYSSFEYARKHNAKYLVRSKMQAQLLRSLGMPEHHILDKVGKKDDTVCTGKGYEM